MELKQKSEEMLPENEDAATAIRDHLALVIANKELVLQNTKLKKTVYKLLKANKNLTLVENQLEEVNQELETFSYSISHDLRTPLRAINGYADMLKEGYENILDAKANRIIDVIVDNAKKMRLLIDGLLSYSRMAGLPTVKETIDMKKLVFDTIKELTKTDPQAAKAITVHSMPKCQGHVNMLQQVWRNLIGNAIKYSRKSDHPQIEIGAMKNKESHIYYAKDNGVGFDMKYATRLFGVFQRLHGHDEFEGIGLSLAVARRIISKHGGKIWVESVVNEGTTFYFSIPKNTSDNKKYSDSKDCTGTRTVGHASLS